MLWFSLYVKEAPCEASRMVCVCVCVCGVRLYNGDYGMRQYRVCLFVSISIGSLQREGDDTKGGLWHCCNKGQEKLYIEIVIVPCDISIRT